MADVIDCIPDAYDHENEDEWTTRPKARGVEVARRFTVATYGLDDVLEDVEWEERDVEIVNPTTGEKVFAGEGLEFPKSWSQNCATLVAEKYFRVVETADGSKVRETSVREMITRVVKTIANWGTQFGYWRTHNGRKAFEAELGYILVHQIAAFNSPVWFNVGTKSGRLDEEQCSACFLLGVDDTMESILQLAVEEGLVYKGGSGSGVNYSKLRSSREALSGGGTSSGPVSFIRKDDANGGSIKSGGSSRRAAKMAILNVDHGDILEFIKCKAEAEKAAQILAASGVISTDFRDPYGAYGMVPFQNANHSVRVNDQFMEAVEEGLQWDLWTRDGCHIETLEARDVWTAICEAAWLCGDPGIQFHDTINRWHTSPAEGPIDTSNPCSEFMYLDFTSCNLASINLCADSVQPHLWHIVDVMITAMDILVSGGGFPTPKIQEMSRKYRPLGLGFTNLGAYLMRRGIAYDSDKGRHEAAEIMSNISARGYHRSAELARDLSPFEGFEMNRASMLEVMRQHQMHAAKLNKPKMGQGPYMRNGNSAEMWDQAAELGSRHGFRNGQISVLAPAGTISFLMDCDTTGIEPDLSLKKYKKLVGGGTIEIVNRCVHEALYSLDYSKEQVDAIVDYVAAHGSVVGAPFLVDDDLPVFDCALEDPVGGRSISPEGHVRMMAAVQPFISGAISKTVNVPNSYTPEDIGRVYQLAWTEGVKAIAVYRDGCKASQPLSQAAEEEDVAVVAESVPGRTKLPQDCDSKRHKFTIGGQEGYMHVGVYDDGTPGELFVRMSKQGSTVQGLLDTVAVLTSLALQYGVPLEALVNKFSYTQFDPQGITDNPDIRFAHSPVDYIFRHLAKFVPTEETAPKRGFDAIVEANRRANEELKSMMGKTEFFKKPTATGQACDRCGNQTQRAGSCLTCSTCGWTSGCG